MPLYDFRCNTCGVIKEFLVKRSEVDEAIPCDCETEAKMERLNKITNTSFILKGNWFKNNQSY